MKKIIESLPPLTDPVEIFGVILGIIGLAIIIPMWIKIQREWNEGDQALKKQNMQRENKL
ncbi:MAG TPA: hypothetical protein VD993_02455 [Chitinophagaceae bacterium]|nr:hypothetical protein [Chitinophagaceae bacterium]